MLLVFWRTFSDLLTDFMHMLQNHTSVSVPSAGPMPPLMPGLSFSRGLINLLVVPVQSTTVLLQNLTAQVCEGLIYVDAASSGGLVVGLGSPLLN